ncbi:hypothetical protein NG799_15685, partial [Laspinema sp. D1]|nr:hypothetical protein [Laspinema sp. D2a]
MTIFDMIIQWKSLYNPALQDSSSLSILSYHKKIELSRRLRKKVAIFSQPDFPNLTIFDMIIQWKSLYNPALQDSSS